MLVRAKLDRAPLVALANSLENVSPLDIDNLLKAFAHSKDKSVGLAQLAGLKQSSARSALRIETLKPQLTRFPPTVQKRAEELYDLLRADTAQQRARLEHLLTAIPEGDVRRGQAVFQANHNRR